MEEGQKDEWFKLSEGHLPVQFKILSGPIKAFYTDHALARILDRRLDFLPFLCRSKENGLHPWDVKKNLMKELEGVPEEKFNFYKQKFPQAEFGPDDLEEIREIFERSWLNYWRTQYLHDILSFESMAIEKYSTFDNTPEGEVHKVTFLNYWDRVEYGQKKRVYYLMGVDVTPVPSGYDVISNKPKHRTGQDKFFTAEEDYSTRVGKHEIHWDFQSEQLLIDDETPVRVTEPYDGRQKYHTMGYQITTVINCSESYAKQVLNLDFNK
tara:strand:+ start:2621 stop:3421 length:801 start_codon:yes stop_codon:yes gene_type:complete